MSTTSGKAKPERKQGLEVPPEERAEIAAALKAGRSQYSLAKEYRRSTATIHAIKVALNLEAAANQKTTEDAIATRSARMRENRVKGWEILQNQTLALIGTTQASLKRTLDLIKRENETADKADAYSFQRAVERANSASKITGEPVDTSRIEYPRAPRPNEPKLLGAYIGMNSRLINDLGMVTVYANQEQLDSDDNATTERPGEVIARRLAGLASRFREAGLVEGSSADAEVAEGVVV